MEKTVLIVEDEFIVADDLQMTLQNAGYSVVGIADDVQTARSIILDKKPSLVLLDIHLKGGVSGIALANELKQKNIAFVFLSANSNHTILEEAKSTDPYGFLVKPFREKDLLVMIDIAFYKHENSNEVRWRKEIQLQSELYGIEQSSMNLREKLLEVTKSVQKVVQFDLIAFRLPFIDQADYQGLYFFRCGFKEYQTIGMRELGVIARLQEHEVKAIMINSPVDRKFQLYNGPEFTKERKNNAMRELLARHFSLVSELIFPIVLSKGETASIALFRRNNASFTVENSGLLFRMQHALTAVLASLAEAEPVTQKAWGEDRGQNGRAKLKSILGNSAAMLEALDLVAQVAPVDTSVLILGESGTGKEKIAEAIHQLSPRNNRAFIKINCAALPPSLIESELFGHEKGSFTNAFDRRIGKFELATKGTIFLDEIGELPVEMQVKLLRVLQEKEIDRIGGKEPVRVDVRIIAATNRNLQEEMANGRFRLDLYYRLNVFPISLAPLRERREDINELSEFFAREFCRKFNKAYGGISDEMQAQLHAYDFPGNVRELENIIEYAVIVNDGRSKLALKRPLQTNSKGPVPVTAVKTLEDLKKLQRQTETEYLTSILRKTGGRIRGKNGAAEILNEKPTTLESRLLKLGIRKENL
ncbi:MAG: sigma 54-interacting transcriptional regulator [Williamsia sp.]|nr:sigma 54-interacting transcriptional regulator [Williamsia sp.]